MRIAAVSFAAVVAAAAVAAGGCLLSEAPPRPCCAACDEAPVTVTDFDCSGSLKSPVLCPQRSTCVLDAYIGDGPATCCASCDSPVPRSEPGGRCGASERYLHECPVESACFQGWRASLLGSSYLPFVSADAAVGGALGAAWQSQSGALWVVGEAGRVLRRDGGAWTAFDGGTGEPLTAIWGAADDDVWAAGFNGTLLHFDGKAWTRVKIDRPAGAPPASAWHLFGLWGSAAEDVWVVGAGGSALHYDGAEWTPSEMPTRKDLTAVWGESAHDVWAVGAEGTIMHFDGAAWVKQRSPTSAYLFGVWGRFAVGHGGTIIARADGTWRAFDSPTTVTLTAIGGELSTDGELFIVGRRGLVLRRSAGGPFEPVTYFSPSEDRDLLGVSHSARRVALVGDAGAVLLLDRPK